MSQWITVYSFPMEKELTELARFIQSHGLPVRIIEKGKQQCVIAEDTKLAELLRPLISHWDTEKIDLDFYFSQLIRDLEINEVDSELNESEGKESSEPDSERGERTYYIPSFPLDSTPFTFLLIALCFLGWFLFTSSLAGLLLITPDPAGTSVGQSTLAKHLQEGEYWRLWSPAIVHFSFLQALMNALALWILARPIEVRGGASVLIALVVLGGLVANLTQFLWAPQSYFAGMSGVIYTLVGFALVVQRWQPAWQDIPRSILLVMTAWLVLSALGIFGFILGVNFANPANVGGLLSGLLSGLIYCAIGGARNFYSGDIYAREL
ncbi:rhomboid family intramembrane serine protease [Microbulbifer sp. TRSA001]|uniref:rhomboid family intramembrane serine protease n=1 Tax=unclassified Microbulbifer TaxID=2619833 RepID=UPI0024AD5DFD|nr:rhomboid family intramembrane serine protease [Microbulbifer sp. VAAF005]WHI45243.1 rhomboid family intramembrane serine protease [Microbulbifer sp. VAAF005]